MHFSLVLRNVATYPSRQVAITTCSELYQRWRGQKLLYRNAPPKGLDFNIDYVDTKTEVSSDSPLVLALHGSPGTYKDFTNVINYLTNQGVRVVAPNFPDCASTIEKGIFRNSAEEKAELLADFLETVGISKIDVMLTHSSAVYPAMVLYLKNNYKINSFAMLNPPGHRILRAVQPYWVTNTFVQLYFFHWGRFLIRKVGVPLLKSINVKVRLDNLDNVIMAGCAMVYSGYDQFEDKLKYLKRVQAPTLMLFSKDDRLIEENISYEMAKILGATEDQIWQYDENGVLTKKGKNGDWLKVIGLEEGSHYPMWKFPNIVNTEIQDLLSKTCEKQPS